MRRYSSSPSKILIIHFTGRLGDSLFFTPILKSLTTKYSNSKIDYMCHRNTHELFLNFPGLNKISIISKRKAIFRGWFRQKKYDLAFVSFSHNEEFETIIKFANRVSNEIISFKPLDPLMEEEITHVAPREFSGHISSYYSNLISSIGIELITNRNQYFPTKDECNIAKNELKKFKSKKQIFIGFKLTSLKSRSYRDWPKENFLEFIHLLKLENIQPTLLA